MPKTSRTKDMIPLSVDFVPGPAHVICAKGKAAKQHPGNKFLKHLVQSSIQEYSACDTKLDRSFIVSRILKVIRQNGGFVRFVDKKGWHDIGDRNAREKIGQAFRDALHPQFQSSTKAKSSIRRTQKRSSFGSSAGSCSSSSGISCASSSQENSNKQSTYSDEDLEPNPIFFPPSQVAFARGISDSFNNTATVPAAAAMPVQQQQQQQQQQLRSSEEADGFLGYQRIMADLEPTPISFPPTQVAYAPEITSPFCTNAAPASAPPQQQHHHQHPPMRSYNEERIQMDDLEPLPLSLGLEFNPSTAADVELFGTETTTNNNNSSTLFDESTTDFFHHFSS